MDDPKCWVTWEMQGGLEGVGSLRIPESWLAIENVEKYGMDTVRKLSKGFPQDFNSVYIILP